MGSPPQPPLSQAHKDVQPYLEGNAWTGALASSTPVKAHQPAVLLRRPGLSAAIEGCLDLGLRGREEEKPSYVLGFERPKYLCRPTRNFCGHGHTGILYHPEPACKDQVSDFSPHCPIFLREFIFNPFVDTRGETQWEIPGWTSWTTPVISVAQSHHLLHRIYPSPCSLESRVKICLTISSENHQHTQEQGDIKAKTSVWLTRFHFFRDGLFS